MDENLVRRTRSGGQIQELALKICRAPQEEGRKPAVPHHPPSLRLHASGVFVWLVLWLGSNSLNLIQLRYMNIFDCKKLADEIASELKTEVDDLRQNGTNALLAILAIEPDKRSLAYIKAKVTRAGELGIKTKLISLPVGTSVLRIKATLNKIAGNDMVHGIIIQLPLPSHFNEQELIDLIPPQKDVDGLTTTNTKLLAMGKPLFTPATPLAVMEILKHNNIDLSGKTIAIIGQGKLVGLPLTKLLKNYPTNVLMADRSTKNLADITQKADVIVSATGQPNLIKADMIKDDVVVIDVGISIINGAAIGDVDFGEVAKKASLITPAIGGVGPMTVVMLMGNVIEAAKMSVK